MISVHLVSYGAAAVGFFLLAAMLLTSWRGRLQGGLLVLACVVSACWAGLLAARGWIEVPLNGVFLAEVARSASWLVFAAALAATLGISGKLRWLAQASWIATLAGGAWLWSMGGGGESAGSTGPALITGGVAMSLAGLVLMEQIYRSAPAESRWALKFLCLGAAGMFAYDLVLYSHAYVMQQLSAAVWSARGFANALVVPMLAVSARRNPHWSVDIFVSRHALFYTTVLTAAGLYLVGISLAGFYVRQFGGEWGDVAQVVVLFAAVMLLAAVTASGAVRSRLKVFLAKHFYRNRYDYRDEWLRLIDTLSAGEAATDARRLSIQAMAQILGCQGGVLWFRDEPGGRYLPVAAHHHALPIELAWSDEDSLPAYLARTQWIVEMAEWRQDPGRYAGLELPATMQGFGLIVPLFLQQELAGFIGLSCEPDSPSLNFEDRDLLKTVGRQLATHIARQDLDAQVTEHRQFAAFNKLTAFLMHDLKNVAAQLSLVLRNAEKHRGNPEFVDDALDTVGNSVTRIHRLIEHFQGTNSPAAIGAVDIDKVLTQLVDNCTDRMPRPGLSAGSIAGLVATGDSERLLRGLEHLVRNAQDASDAQGTVAIEANTAGEEVCIEVADKGAGMSAEFIRDRLFRPFDSTKGSKGMGVGAYQVRESVRQMGGRVEVESEPGKGTRFRIFLAAVSGAAGREKTQDHGQLALGDHGG